MARAFVKKNMGRSFVVALGGHDHGLGEAEFISVRIEPIVLEKSKVEPR